jgi:hypothetical protein
MKFDMSLILDFDDSNAMQFWILDFGFGATGSAAANRFSLHSENTLFAALASVDAGWRENSTFAARPHWLRRKQPRLSQWHQSKIQNPKSDRPGIEGQ